MVEDVNGRQIKLEQIVLPSGVVVEYYGTQGGPSIEECMNQVAEMAAQAIIYELFGV